MRGSNKHKTHNVTVLTFVTVCWKSRCRSCLHSERSRGGVLSQGLPGNGQKTWLKTMAQNMAQNNGSK